MTSPVDVNSYGRGSPSVVAEALLDLGAEGVEPAILDRVLEARALAARRGCPSRAAR